MARLGGDDLDETGGTDLSPSARRLLEVSMNEEDPLLAKKRIEKRISNRNVGRHTKDSARGSSREKKEAVATDIFKPWDDKPDVTLSVNDNKAGQ